MQLPNYLTLPRLCSLLNLLAALLPMLVSAHVKHLSNDPFPGKMTAEFKSNKLNFEAPHLSAVNGSTGQWWWFDVLTTSTNISALNIIFFSSAYAAFPLTSQPDNILSIAISAYTTNGTHLEYSIPVHNASITWGQEGKLNLGDGAIGEFVGPGVNATFSASNGLDTFIVTIDSPTFGIQGELKFTSTAPPHYPCGVDVDADQTLRIIPHIGWTNAMPSANVTGIFIVGNGTDTLHFVDALGYHDTNWMNQPLFESINSWYWGHAKLGPYTIVWGDIIDSSGNEHVTGYVADQGTPIMASCKFGAVSVRPQGDGAQYPPDSQHADFASLHIEMTTEDGLLVADVVPMGTNLAVPGLYQLNFGSIKGGLEGEQVYEGIAEFEEFTVLGYQG